MVRLRATCKLCRFRYLALTIPPFLAGCIGSNDDNPAYWLLGVTAIITLRAISSLGNCVTDRVEDAVDHPLRVQQCEVVGYPNLLRIVRALTVLYLSLVAGMALFAGIHPAASLLWVLFLLVKLSYSFGPRLKPKRLSATVLLGGVSGGMLFLGWIGSGFDEVEVAITGGVLLWAMGASLVGSKDAPNVDGDAKIGYFSVYRRLIDAPHPARRAVLIVSRPYLLAVPLAFVSMETGGPGLRLLWCFILYPAAIAFALALTRAQTAAGRSLVRELGYLYWILFMDVVLVALVPQPWTIVVALAALAWYLGATRYAHPDPAPPARDSLRAAFASASI
jgi:hypothetical protein